MTVRDVSVAKSAGMGPIGCASDTSGRHWAGSRVGRQVARHGIRFTSFSLIGAATFALGVALQIACVRLLRLGADTSYLMQGTISIEVSFLANYFWTWRDVDVRFWPCGLKFNAQKIALSGPNFALYACFVWLGANYVLANIVVTAIFTLINYTLGDRWVFVPVKSRAR